MSKSVYTSKFSEWLVSLVLLAFLTQEDQIKIFLFCVWFFTYCFFLYSNTTYFLLPDYTLKPKGFVSFFIIMSRLKGRGNGNDFLNSRWFSKEQRTEKKTYFFTNLKRACIQTSFQHLTKYHEKNLLHSGCLN